MNKVALVTGASGGIGEAIALELASQGYDIGIHYRSNEEKAKQISLAISDLGRKSTLLQGDLTSSEQCTTVIEKCIQDLGTVDALINNAGVTKDTLIMRMKDSDFDDVIKANLNSCFYMTREVITYMLKKRSGKIINISSVIGLMGNAGQANYAASKAGIIGFSKSCAKEVAKRGICVNVVAPGYIITPMTDKLNDKTKDMIMAKIPLNKLGTPKDVSGLIAFLCSDKADYITGQVLSVDGGMNI